MKTNIGLMSIVAATILISCGGSSSSNNTKTTPDSQQSNLAGTICLDANKNSVCEASETSKKLKSWKEYGDYKETLKLHALTTDTKLPNSSYPLAYNEDNGLILRALANGKTITPHSTLVYQAYKVDKKYTTQKEAEEAISKQFPDINKNEEFIKGLQKAVSENPTEDYVAIVGTYLGKVIETKDAKEISKISVSQKEIQQYEKELKEKEDSSEVSINLTKLELSDSFGVDMTENIEKLKNDGWKDAFHSYIVDLAANDSKILIGSKRHNALSLIDLNGENFKYNTFASLKGAGDGEVDAESGASENYFTLINNSIHITKDNYAYAYIYSKKGSKSDKNSYGLFKTKIDTNNMIQDYTESLKIEKRINKFSLSPSENVLFLYDNDNKQLEAYDKNFKFLASKNIKNVTNILVYNDTTAYILIDNFYIYKVTIQDNTFIIDNTPLSSPIGSPSFMQLAKNKIVLTNTDGYIGTINLDNNKTKILKTEFSIEGVSISPNGKFLATIDKKLIIINLDALEVQNKVTLDESSYSVTFAGNNQIAYKKDKNVVKVLNIKDTGKIITPEDKLKDKIKDLEKIVNGGNTIEIISDNLTLETNIGNVSFQWSTSLSDNINLSDGKVTRPTYDKGDATGTLSVKASGYGATYDKTYNITIKKSPKVLSTPVKSELEDVKNIYYPATNNDGSVLIVPLRTDKKKYVLRSFTVNKDGTLKQASGDTNYDDDKVIGVGISGSYAIGLAEKDDTGRIYSAKINDDGTLANSVTSSISITSGEPKSIEFNENNTKAVVLVEVSDDKFASEIYSINPENGNISLEQTINMGDDEYEKVPPAINKEGTTVYQLDDDEALRKNTTDPNNQVTVKLKNPARLCSGANRVFVTSYDANIYSFNSDLTEQKTYNLASYGRIYAGEVREINGENFLYIAMKSSSEAKNGVYRLKILNDGTLEEDAFAHSESGAYRIAVSGDGKRIFFSLGGDEVYVVK